MVAFADKLDNRIAWFSLDAENEQVRLALLAGETVCFLEGGYLVTARGEERRRLVHVDQVPATRGGAARYNISNALAATATALALGIGDEAIRKGLAMFRGDESDNPGRGNWFEREITTGGGTGTVGILVDFAHNEHGMAALANTVRRIGAERIILLIGQAGDRLDKDIADLVKAACGMNPDQLLIAELPGYERGRKPFEVPQIIRNVARACGISEASMEDFPGPREATAQALRRARAGDLLVLLALTQRQEALALVHDFMGDDKAVHG